MPTYFVKYSHSTVVLSTLKPHQDFEIFIETTYGTQCTKNELIAKSLTATMLGDIMQV